jgi:tRNA pseudouridine13 synthase
VIPDLDSKIGILVYSTKFPGIGGKIRVEPEDFQVSELISEKSKNSINESNGYAVYKLKKKKIDTNHALSGIFRKKGIRLKSLGLKDASSLTEQFVSNRKKGKHL